MPKDVRVRWSIFGSEDPFNLIAADIETDLLVRGGSDASVQTAVNSISADYFGDRVWEKLFGLDLVEAEVLLEISEPAAWAGAYEVSLSRVTRAECQRVNDPRAVAEPMHQQFYRNATELDQTASVPETALH